MSAYGMLAKANRWLPKKNKIIFNSFPDLDGNALALYEYIFRNRPDILKKYAVKWMITSMPLSEAKRILRERTGSSGHSVVAKKSLRGIFNFLTAKYVISTHSYLPGVGTARNQKSINLWHGMPLKRIGRLLEGGHSNGLEDEADTTVATSPLFQDIMAKVFGIDPSEVYVTGLPRNDALLEDSRILQMIPDADHFTKVIFWLPTYRTSIKGDIRTDGDDSGFGVAEVLQNYFDDLDAILKKKGYLLVIKPHPMDAMNQISFRSSENIRVLHNEDLQRQSVSLYEVLSGCDVLLTDYSSVYIDFLLTGKPIAFVCDDMGAYGQSRGFCFDDPKELMPGEGITKTDQLLSYLNNMDELNAKWEEKYAAVRSQFHQFVDRGACERTCSVYFPKD